MIPVSNRKVYIVINLSINMKLDNVNLLESSEVHRRVLYHFFSFPINYIGLNNLSKSISTSKTATKTAVMHLIKEGFLQKEEIGKNWRMQANPKHPFMITRKIPYNLQLIYESRIVNAVYEKIPNARSIILFGSYRWGTDNEKSDIDIAVEILGNKKMKIEQLGVIEKLGFRKNVKVNMHIFSKKGIDINLMSNIANGIVLDGFLEVAV